MLNTHEPPGAVVISPVTKLRERISDHRTGLILDKENYSQLRIGVLNFYISSSVTIIQTVQTAGCSVVDGRLFHAWLQRHPMLLTCPCTI